MQDEAPSRYPGGCLCGAVRYVATGTPPIVGNCHCQDCRRVSGSAYAPTLFFPADAVEITGEPALYERPGGSGQLVRRGFCAACGTQLFGLPSVMKGLIGIRAGTLDDPAQYQPQVDIFTAHAPHWDRMLDETIKFEASPTLPAP